MVDKDKKNMVKARLLVLSEMFYQKTDEDHKMDTFEIIDYLEKNGVPANTKTLRSDIALLKQRGMDIVTTPGRPNKYFCGSRLFDIPEVKLMIDAVNSSRFITDKRSRVLNRKLLSTVSEHQKKQLKRSVYTTEKIKPKNEKIFYAVDMINDAIQARLKISFQIREYGGNKEKTLRHDGEVYVISPYAMYWNQDFYYVVGWCDKHDKISSFRVDRMVDPTILDDKAVKKPKDFKVSEYAHKVFEMFDGDEVRVKLECRNELMKYVIDRFGEAVETEPAGDETFICYADVRLSPTFYGWVFGFSGNIRVLEPQEAVQDMIRMSGKMLRAEMDTEYGDRNIAEMQCDDLFEYEEDPEGYAVDEDFEQLVKIEYLIYEADTFIGKEARIDVTTEIDAQTIDIRRAGKILIVDVTLYPFNEDEPEKHVYRFEKEGDDYIITDNSSTIGKLTGKAKSEFSYELYDWKQFIDTDALDRTINIAIDGDGMIKVFVPGSEEPYATISEIKGRELKTIYADGETMMHEKYMINTDERCVDHFFGLIAALPYCDFNRN